MCDWLNKFYGFSDFQLLYTTLIVDKMDEYGALVTQHVLTKKTKVMWY